MRRAKPCAHQAGAQLRQSCGDKFVLETLPPYDPELNPVEYIWGYMKQRELANLYLETIGRSAPTHATA
jgi:transposase